MLCMYVDEANYLFVGRCCKNRSV